MRALGETVKRLWADPVSRLTLMMSALFSGWGVGVPFLPVWLQAERGLSGDEIGMVLAAAPLGRLIVAPLLAAWADGVRDRRTALCVLAGLAAVGYGALFFVHGFIALLIAVFFAGAMSSGLGPLLEGATMRRAQASQIPFGLARAVGSGAFIVGSICGGALIAAFSPQMALIWLSGAHLLTFAVGLFLILPDPAAPGPRLSLSERLVGGFGLFRNPRFALVVLAGALIQSAHAFYYNFGALTWKAQGVPEGLIGVLISVGVVAEIGVLVLLARIERRFTPELLMAIGAAGAVFRWAMMALAPGVEALFALQTLHALSFAAAHMGALRLVLRETPQNAQALGQTLYAAVSSGLFMGVMTQASGGLFEAYGSGGYAAMAVWAGLGLGLSVLVWRMARPASNSKTGRNT